jgi:hypothetical protein
MASDENKLGAALAAGLVGLGMGALIGAALTNRSDPHATFVNRLLGNLAPSGLTLAAADLGLGPTGQVWLLTVRLPNGNLMNLQAPIDPGVLPLEPSLADTIAQRIITYLQPRGLLR